MDIEHQQAMVFLAFATMLFGGHSLLYGKLTHSSSEDGFDEKYLYGYSARLCGALMLLASYMFFSGNLNGYWLLVISFVLPIILPKGKKSKKDLL